MGHIILPKRRNLFPNKWALWDEASEFGLADDNTFVCFFSNPAIGGDEFGQGGGLSSANQHLSQNGAVAAATGSPTYRPLDGNDDEFTATAGLTNKLINNQPKWTVLLKLSNVTNVASDVFLDFASANDGFRMSIDATGLLKLTVLENTVSENNSTTNTPDYASNTPTWYAVAADGVNPVQAGFFTSNQKPRTWEDFAAGNKTQVGSFLGVIDDTLTNLIFNTSGPRFLEARAYYIIVSKTSILGPIK